MIKPYYETKLGKLYHGDCLDIMPQLEPVDLVLTDPPYGTTACSWDTVIPFEPMWKQLKRIIKKNRAIVLFSSQPFTSALVMSNVKMFKYELVWDKSKSTGHLDAKRKPMKKHENILIFGNKGWPQYIPQNLIDGIFKTGRNVNMQRRVYSQFGNHVNSFKGNYPKSILKIKNPSGKEHLHPTQKPVALMEYLIKTYTNENEIVLDFTIGSGTTAIACERLNRKWIGIEIEEKYCKIAAKRIEENLTAMERIERSEKGITKKTGLLF